MSHHSSPVMLTICIPTFQRDSRVTAQVRRLLAHLPPATGILVLDNGSTDSTESSVLAICAVDSRVSYVRHPVNLGVDANVLRAIEMARGRWAWLLGDDEAIDPNSLAALSEVLQHNTADVIHLAGPGAQIPDHAPLDFASPKEFVAAFYDVGRFSHLSSTVLRVERALPHLRAAYASCGLLHSYSAVAARMLVSGGRVSICRVPILASSISRDGPRWNSLHAHLGAWQTLREVLPAQLRGALDRKQAACRFRAIYLAALSDALGSRDYAFAGSDLLRLARLAPLARLPSVALLAVATCAQRVPRLGALCVVAGLRVFYWATWRAKLNHLYRSDTEDGAVRRVAAALRARARRRRDVQTSTY